jgi:hypothetical protein
MRAGATTATTRHAASVTGPRGSGSRQCQIRTSSPRLLCWTAAGERTDCAWPEAAAVRMPQRKAAARDKHLLTRRTESA